MIGSKSQDEEEEKHDEKERTSSARFIKTEEMYLHFSFAFCPPVLLTFKFWCNFSVVPLHSQTMCQYFSDFGTYSQNAMPARRWVEVHKALHTTHLDGCSLLIHNLILYPS